MIEALRSLVASSRYESGAFTRFADALPGESGVRATAPWPLSSGSQGSELYEFLTNGLSSGGIAVTEKTAMMVSSVYACVGLIAGAVMSLPALIYRRRENDGAPERIEHDLWWLLNEEAGNAWTAAALWEFLVWSRLLHGDAFALILRNRRRDRIVAFEPLHPGCVEVVRVVEEGQWRLKYRVSHEGFQGVYDQDDVIHIPGPGFDGLRSMSAIRYALRHPGGIALAADEYAARFFSNGARPDFVIEWAGKLDDAAKATLRESWTQTFGGPRKSHLPAIMTGGSKVHALDMKADDAQLIEQRRFQVEDICRIFGVPPHMVGSTEKTTSWGSGIEQLSIGFVKYTLGRHLVAFEQEFNRKCFMRGPIFMEFVTAGLERGDIKSRTEAYRAALGRAGEDAWMTLNEVRRLENLPPDDDAASDELKRASASPKENGGDAAEPDPAIAPQQS